MGASQSTLSALVQGVSISKWQYKNSSGSWADYPTTSDNSNITSGTLVVKPSHSVFVNNVAQIKLVTNQDEDTRAAESASQVLLYFQTQEAPEIGIEIPYEMTPAGATKSTASVPVVDQTMKTLNIEGNEYIGYLSIPDLSLELPVMNQWDYTRLKIAPCLYYGSVFTDDLVIAAHNYKSHFGKLEELSLGSFVDFTDAEGTVHRYRVTVHIYLYFARLF